MTLAQYYTSFHATKIRKKERKRLSLSMLSTHSLLISMQKRSGGKKNTRELCRKSKEAES
jgi:hypothetical protein